MGSCGLILGGSSSGKSMYAQRLARSLAGTRPLYYLATMEPRDAEDHARVAKHRRERAGWGFETLEIPLEVGSAPAEGGIAPLDSLTALAANAMFSPGGPGPEKAEDFLLRELDCLIRRAETVIAVSDDLFSDGGIYDEYTETYRRLLGHLHRALAGRAKQVTRLTLGIPDHWKEAAAWARPIC